jgi:quinol monooxygenase YgiN
MQVQIINFGIQGIDEAALSATLDDLAPQFAALPGLLAKTWLRDSAAGVYGGVYHWRSQADLDAFRAGPLYRAVGEHPNLVDITDRSFDVFDGPTAVTRGFPSLAAN